LAKQAAQDVKKFPRPSVRALPTATTQPVVTKVSIEFARRFS
jgi:hypothetical protein